MATIVPAPTLDTRNGDLVVAEAIGSLPSELSDRSDSNPAVVIIEACGNQFDKLLFAINQWPAAVVQKALNLIGVTIKPAAAGLVTQTFTLSAPQQGDTVIPTGTQVATTDGTIVYATTSDLTIKAYTTPAGTIALTSGSAAVVGTTTAFPNDGSWNGYQIQVQGGAWYTILSVTDTTHLTLTAPAASTTSGAFNVGPITGTVTAQCSTTGLTGKVGAGALIALQSSPAGVASTTNAAAATNAADAETTAAAIARAPTEFAARDVACSAADYGAYAAKILGSGGRAQAKANTNGSAAQSGYVTIGLLSPTWTASAPVSASERGAVIRDLQARSFAGATLVDVAASIQSYTSTPNLFGCAVYRNAQYDEASTQFAVAGAINTLLSPNTYPWGRTIFIDDLVQALDALPQIDRVLTVSPTGALDTSGNALGGVPAVGLNYQTTPNNVTFTTGSATATGTAGDFTSMIPRQTYLIDSVNKQAYLVVTVSSGTLTLHTPWTGTTGAVKPPWFNSVDVTLPVWYSLPYSNLATSGTAPASVLIVGAV